MIPHLVHTAFRAQVADGITIQKYRRRPTDECQYPPMHDRSLNSDTYISVEDLRFAAIIRRIISANWPAPGDSGRGESMAVG
jgi:hypothetical protein